MEADPDDPIAALNMAEARDLVAWLVSAGLRTKSVRDLARQTGVMIPDATP